MDINDLAGLSRPIEKLIESIQAGIGVAFEPRRIRRGASADADAKITMAHADAEVLEICARAQARVSLREAQRQANIEQISARTATHLPDCVSNDAVDPDWIARFFSDCQDVTNDHMQAVWARVLAGEVARPGAFSRRTLSIVRDLNEQTAAAFAAVCAFATELHGSAVPVVFYNHTTREYANKLSFEQMIDLESVGLIHFSPLGNYIEEFREGVEEDHLAFRLLGQQWWFFPKNPAQLQDEFDITVGFALFTRAGSELAAIVEPQYPALTDQDLLDLLGRMQFLNARLAQPTGYAS